jgi:2'-5' RNA ligase
MGLIAPGHILEWARQESGHVLESAYREKFGGYGCLLVSLPEPEAQAIRNFAYSLPDDGFIKHPETGEPHIEYKSHITVKYGLLPTDARSVAAVIGGSGKINGVFGKLGIFSTDKHDVLFVKAHSTDLFRLNNKATTELPCIENEYQYSPHMTIAYLKPGEGKKYEGMTFFSGVNFSFNRVEYSDSDGNNFPIDLKG